MHAYIAFKSAWRAGFRAFKAQYKRRRTQLRKRDYAEMQRAINDQG